MGKNTVTILPGSLNGSTPGRDRGSRPGCNRSNRNTHSLTRKLNIVVLSLALTAGIITILILAPKSSYVLALFTSIYTTKELLGHADSY